MRNILVVDDTPNNLNILVTLLEQNGYKVRPAINGDLALTAVAVEPPDLILLDIRMPGKDGYEVCAILKSQPNTCDIPIIFISALSDIEDKIRGFKAGGVDYITKPFHFPEVLARVNAQITLQEQRHALEEASIHNQRLAQMRSELLSIVSHDLKGPLNLALGFTQALMEQNSDEQAQPLLAQLHTMTRFMLNVVVDLLDMGAFQGEMPFHFQPMPLAEVLNDCAENYAVAAQQKELTLLYTPPAPDIRVNIDPTRFAQAINNLLANAVQYTTQGEVELSAGATSEAVIISIRDTGAGIPAHALPRIFEPFYRVQRTKHHAADGTGLGLSITGAIIERHDGKIAVESKLDAGTTFTITLPRV